MINPPLNVLMEKVDCRYTLAVFSAKRAREIVNGDKALVKCESTKAVTIALTEIAEDKISYIRTKTGIK